MPARRFVILCVRRTGSNFLSGLLNAHPDILCHAELFNRHRVYTAWDLPPAAHALLADRSLRDAEPLAYLERVWALDLGHAAVGFKLLDSQQPQLTAPLLDDPGLTRILLERRSRLRAYISWLRAGQTGQCAGNTYDGLRVVVHPQPMLDFINFYNRYYHAVRAHMRQRGQPWIDLYYEDLVAHPAQQIAPILAALGVDTDCAAALQGVHHRQSRDRLQDSIQNYDQIAYMLRGTVLESELQEPEAAA